MPKKSPTKKTKPQKFRFVIRKYVIASSVQQALKYESKSPVHEVFVADRAEDRELSEAIGFEYTPQDPDFDEPEFPPELKRKK